MRVGPRIVGVACHHVAAAFVVVPQRGIVTEEALVEDRQLGRIAGVEGPSGDAEAPVEQRAARGEDAVELVVLARCVRVGGLDDLNEIHERPPRCTKYL